MDAVSDDASTWKVRGSATPVVSTTNWTELPCLETLDACQADGRRHEAVPDAHAVGPGRGCREHEHAVGAGHTASERRGVARCGGGRVPRGRVIPRNALMRRTCRPASGRRVAPSTTRPEIACAADAAGPGSSPPLTVRRLPIEKTAASDGPPAQGGQRPRRRPPFYKGVLAQDTVEPASSPRELW